MGDQRHDLAPPLLEVLNLQQVAGEAAQPDPDNADNNDNIPGKGGAFLSWKSSRKRLGPVKPFLATLLLLLLLEAQYSVSSRLRSYLKTSQLPLDDASMQKYLEDFNKAANAMNETWRLSESPVQQAFQKHFTPTPEDSQDLPDDPLATISDHVAKMRKCSVPPNSSVKERRDFAQHLQLLRNICRTVTLRLEELKWFVYMNEEFDVPVPVPGHDEPCNYPALQMLEGRVEDGLPATHFLKSVGLLGGDSTQKVDEVLTDKLIFLLAIEDKSNAYNLVARYYFERFFEPFGDDYVFKAATSAAEYRIPYNGRPFRFGDLAQAAAPIFLESDSTPNYANVVRLHRIVENWTNEGVRRAAEQQEEENAKYFQNRLNNRREQMRALLKKGIPNDDLVMSALFLL